MRSINSILNKTMTVSEPKQPIQVPKGMFGVPKRRLQNVKSHPKQPFHDPIRTQPFWRPETTGSGTETNVSGPETTVSGPETIN